MSPPESPPVALDAPESGQARSALAAGAKVALVFAVLAVALGLMMYGSDASNAFVYSKLVHEVMDTPAQFHDRELRVEGDLKQGTILFREDPCEWRFVIHKHNRELPVRFPQCIVPDTFKDTAGLVVTVQGKLQDDGTFLANQLIPRCPSKYEMKERQQNGEAMPHEATPAMRMPLDG